MPEVDERYTAGHYNDAAQIGAGRMTYRDTVFVEGTSDADFFKKVMGSRLSWKGLNGKGKVITTRTQYINNQYPTNCENCYFCIDRDYDEVLKKELEQEPEKYLYYQMCLDGRTGGYNDLECFLFASPIFDFVLRFTYDLPPEKITQFREQIIHVAAWMGSYRVANRIVQAAIGHSVFCCNLKRNDTIVDDREYGLHEVNPAYLFQEGFAKIKQGEIKVNWDKFEKKMKSGRAYECDLVIEKAHVIQKLFNDQDPLILMDFCRGHDITYLLCTLLRNHSDKYRNHKRHDVENALEKWPLSSETVSAKSNEFMAQFQMIKDLSAV